jgi:phosphoglycerol transferase MdoB-like AlkP superfamily enzyme
LEGVGTGRFLRAHGFDEVLGPEEMRRTTPKATFSGMGAHDRWTMDLALATLRRLRLARARDGRPFLLTVMNLDPHEPGLAPPGCHLPTGAGGRVQVADVPNDPGAVQALAAYHCADREVGRLLAALDEPGERERTLVVVTADHAAFRTRSNDQVFRGVRAGWSFDRLPLLIRDPTHALPRRWDVLAGTQDVAPTLLHLLGLEGAQTAMGGLSVFGRRRDLPWIAGRIGRRLAYVNDGTQQAEWPVGALPAMCAARRPLLPLEPAPASDGPSPRVTFATPSPRPPDWAAPAVDACDLEHWLRWQDALWTLRRVHPALPAAAAPSQ